MTVLALAGGSFLARAFAGAMPDVRTAPHTEAGRAGLIDGITTIVSFARHPGLGSGPPEPEEDADLTLARAAAERGIPYVFLSSRKVYAPSPDPLREDSPLGPTDAYGAAKLAQEQRLREVLGDRLTVVRLANVFGFERGRTSFMGRMMDGLVEHGRITFDMSPFVERDFLPAPAFAMALARIARDPPGGVVGLGSGIPLPTGRLAMWLIEGFGRGELLVTNAEERDAFVLDIRRLTALTGPPCAEGDLRTTTLALGRRLARA
jgi:UDP-glucose 4-epimerase